MNQLFSPQGIYIDDNTQTIYIADRYNHRIVGWKYDANNGEIVAGGNGPGNRMNQLNQPIDVIVDQSNDSVIICDLQNSRVVWWSRRIRTNQQIIISDIACGGLAMDNNGDLYVSDWMKNEIRCWRHGNIMETIVAGGNGPGVNLNQLNSPSFIFVDQDHSVYVSDLSNHRVVKWMKGAKDGIVVAGGQGQGNNLTQLGFPAGVIVDHLSNVYVAEQLNSRIMRWAKGSREGSIVVGGNGQGDRPNQFIGLSDLSFDRQGNLYAVDGINHRIQKFDVDFD